MVPEDKFGELEQASEEMDFDRGHDLFYKVTGSSSQALLKIFNDKCERGGYHHFCILFFKEIYLHNVLPVIATAPVQTVEARVLVVAPVIVPAPVRTVEAGVVVVAPVIAPAPVQTVEARVVAAASMTTSLSQDELDYDTSDTESEASYHAVTPSRSSTTTSASASSSQGDRKRTWDEAMDEGGQQGPRLLVEYSAAPNSIIKDIDVRFQTHTITKNDGETCVYVLMLNGPNREGPSVFYDGFLHLLREYSAKTIVLQGSRGLTVTKDIRLPSLQSLDVTLVSFPVLDNTLTRILGKLAPNMDELAMTFQTFRSINKHVGFQPSLHTLHVYVGLPDNFQFQLIDVSREIYVLSFIGWTVDHDASVIVDQILPSFPDVKIVAFRGCDISRPRVAFSSTLDVDVGELSKPLPRWDVETRRSIGSLLPIYHATKKEKKRPKVAPKMDVVQELVLDVHDAHTGFIQVGNQRVPIRVGEQWGQVTVAATRFDSVSVSVLTYSKLGAVAWTEGVDGCYIGTAERKLFAERKLNYQRAFKGINDSDVDTLIIGGPAKLILSAVKTIVMPNLRVLDVTSVVEVTVPHSHNYRYAFATMAQRVFPNIIEVAVRMKSTWIVHDHNLVNTVHVLMEIRFSVFEARKVVLPHVYVLSIINWEPTKTESSSMLASILRIFPALSTLSLRGCSPNVAEVWTSRIKKGRDIQLDEGDMNKPLLRWDMTSQSVVASNLRTPGCPELEEEYRLSGDLI